MCVANFLHHSEHTHNIMNKMVSYHDHAAERAQKSLLTLLEAETKSLIMALKYVKIVVDLYKFQGERFL